MKQRFSSLDVKVIANEISHKVVGLRVHNIYDLSSRIFLLKFHAPDVKHHLLIDSGFRCHFTAFVRTTAAAPSAFVTKLRKHLKARRLTAVKQVGTDRILNLQFNDGMFHLFLEFYAGGNIILTDDELKVLSLLRRVEDGPEEDQVKVGSTYTLEHRQNYNGVPELTKDRVRAGLEKSIESYNAKQTDGEPKSGGKKTGDRLRKALVLTISEYPPALIDHCFKERQFDSTTTPEAVCQSEELLDKVLEVLETAKKIVVDITQSEVATGYIIGKVPKEGVEQKADTKSVTNPQGLIYDDYHPFRPKQVEDDPKYAVVEFEGFNKTVDEFYSSIEGQKLESRLAEREAIAKRKLAATKHEHEKRLGGLQHVQELNIRKAEAIQANVARVEEAAAAVNSLIAQGMDWVGTAKFIEHEQSLGNSVAKTIKLPLKLHENTITLLLGEAEVDAEFNADDSGSEPDDASDSDEMRQKHGATHTDTRLAIDINLSLSPWANASLYYDEKKTAAEKTERTQRASDKALKSAEHKIAADLKKGLNQEKAVLRPIRKQFWFEKFDYFISSDGYLVIGGKDVQQNDIIYRKYFKKGDIFVHADYKGASPAFIKNNSSAPDDPIPPSTLSQAGIFVVAGSEAWDSKAVTAAWWAKPDQVSKTGLTGEYVDTGDFVINGAKNYLPPAQLLMGFAMLWQVTEESKANHSRHRVTQSASGDNIDHSSNVHEVDEEEDEDEDFPDAKPHIAESDSDEDFPDAKPVDSSNEDVKEEDSATTDTDTGDGEKLKDENAPLHTSVESTSIVPPESIEDNNVKSPKSDGLKHMSAHQRRLLKKVHENNLAKDQNLSHNDKIDDSFDTRSVVSGTSTMRSTSSTLPRGKRSKLKKAAEKYADQDEEDRELALKLLGVKMNDQNKLVEAAEKRIREDQERREKEARRQQRFKKLADQERRRFMGNEDESDGDKEQEATWKAELLTLDTLVSKPLVGDELVAAIPVCAPWTALAAYKYKIKLQPGSLKRGKAAREILGKWAVDAKVAKLVDTTSQDSEKMWPAEIDLLKAVSDLEAVAIIPMKSCTIMAAGMSSGKFGAKVKAKAGNKGGNVKGGKKSK